MKAKRADCSLGQLGFFSDEQLTSKKNAPPVQPKKSAPEPERKASTAKIKPAIQRKGSAIHFYLDNFFSETDMLLAHRYLYHCAKRPVISNQEYKDAKRECMEYGGGYDVLTQPASDKPIDYPVHVRYLAIYMLFKFETSKPKPDMRGLPYEFSKDSSKMKT